MSMETETTCYKCGKPITAIGDTVHPLCEDCDTAFDDWFTTELAKLGFGGNK